MQGLVELCHRRAQDRSGTIKEPNGPEIWTSLPPTTITIRVFIAGLTEGLSRMAYP